MPTIRNAINSDLPDIKNCALAAYRVYVERIGHEPASMVADFAAAVVKGHLYVALEDGQVVGFVVFYAQQDHVPCDDAPVIESHVRFYPALRPGHRDW